jgi:uncharacterized protein YeaO (DUF488 family)
MTGKHEVQVGRVYAKPDERAGARVLVDRLWPRGMSKERARLNEWRKDIAPSSGLRRWYGHDPERFEEFTRRYRAELTGPPRAEAFKHLQDMAADGPVILLTAAKRSDISEAVVLADLLNTGPLQRDA